MNDVDYFVGLKINFHNLPVEFEGYSEKMLRMLLGYPFFDSLKSKWVQNLASNTDHDSWDMRYLKDNNGGFLCIFYYVLAHHFSHHPGIKEYLQQLRVNPSERSSY